MEWGFHNMTKHEQLISYIQSLEIGSKISVRKIAKDMDVSDGTAYRAIKDAETRGYVSTIGRVGTIRIEKKNKQEFERITFAEVVNIVDGSVIGGREGLYKSLRKFVIGAMELEEMAKYIEPGNLLIVGNRKSAHKLSLEHGAAVLITGGFDTSDEIKELADQLELPIISSTYDTFTVASMINRAIYDRLIKKEIVMVEDIVTLLEQTCYLQTTDTLDAWYKLSEETRHSRYPVVDQQMRVQGIVTSKDVISKPGTETLEKVMTKDPLTVSLKTSVATAAHMMVWEGIELLPVVNGQRKLLGIISRQDVLKAMQYIQRQPQIGETFEELITANVVEETEGKAFVLKCRITPQMISYLGTLSSGVLSTLMTEAGQRLLRRHRKGDLVAENVSIYFLKPIQIDAQIELVPRMLELSRKFGKLEIDVYHEGSLVSKGLLTAQLMDR
jgi:predicted transcriptional regulator